MPVLPESFYAGEVIDVARNLLGKRLERWLDGVLLSGIITETEAYRGEEDLACHARSGKTRRTAVMYGLPGRAYVYFTYGMHWCFNAVCGPSGFPAAVLLRAVVPTRGLEVIAARRSGRKPAEWCSGPARMCSAFAIDGELNGAVLCDDDSPLWISDAPPIPDDRVRTSPRIGIERTPEPWRSKPWRFVAALEEGLFTNG
jgi:DNA-3-methyladenine glycosylase